MMRIVRDDFYRSMTKLAPVSGIVELDGDKLTARNDQHSATINLPADDVEPGAFCLDARALRKLLSAMERGAIVEINSDGSITAGRFSAKLDLVSSNIGEILEPEKMEGFTLPLDRLAIWRLTSTEDVRYYLNGVSIQRGRIASTNGYKLAAVRISELETFSQTAIIHSDTCKLLASLGSGVAQCAFADRVATFQIGNARVVAKTIDGTYPDIDRVIPKDSKTSVKLSALALVNAMRRAGTAATTIEASKAGVTVRSDRLGFVSSEQVDAEVSGPAVRIAFNSQDVRDFLPLLGGDDLALLLGDSEAPAIFKGNDSATTLVLMPMRIKTKMQDAA